MKKVLMLSVLTLFIIYTIVAIFIEIPKVFNNIFFGIVTIFAIYFIVFYSDIGKRIKNRFQENINKLDPDKPNKN